MLHYLLWLLILVLTVIFIKVSCFGTRFREHHRLDGKVIVITGANSGIGFSTALDLAKRGASVILACRNVEKGLCAQEVIRQRSESDKVKFYQLNLASFVSIRKFVTTLKENHKNIHALVNNAGVFWCPFLKTEEGFELNFGVNYLGHFLLTILLLPLLEASGCGKIIHVSSIMYIFGSINFHDFKNESGRYNFVKAYSNSKLGNVLFTTELDKRLKSNHIKTYCVDPGIVSTGIGRDSVFMGSYLYRVILYPIVWVLFKSAWSGSQTVVFCICSPLVRNESGCMYCECEKRYPWPSALDMEDSLKLWSKSIELVGVTSEELSLLRYQ